MKTLWCEIKKIVFTGLIACALFCNSNPSSSNTTSDATPPNAPDSVWIESATYTSITAVWNSVDSIDGYRIVLCDRDAVPIDTQQTTDTIYTFSNLTAGQSYMVKAASYVASVTSTEYKISSVISLFKLRNPRNVKLASSTGNSSVTISFDPTEDNHEPVNFWYRAYLRSYTGAIIDSQDVDSSARTVTFSGLAQDSAYKISLVTARTLGVNEIDSNCVYDTSNSMYNTWRFPYVYVSTYTTPAAVSDTNLIPVRGGMYVMGYIWDRDVVSLVLYGPAHEVVVSSFYMGKYEITAQEYAAFLNARISDVTVQNGKWLAINTDTLGDTLVPFWPLSFNGQSYTVKTGKERFPIIGLTWYGAAAYCNWLSKQKGLDTCYNSSWQCDYAKNGYRLPTEAEFEYLTSRAVTGYKTRFIWGFEWKTTDANVSTETAAAVGSYPAFFGIHDLAGNAMEYVNDWSDVASEMFATSVYYQTCANQGVVKDPRGPSAQVEDFKHLMRGGSWETGMSGNISTYRYANHCNTLDDYGFRVARSVP